MSGTAAEPSLEVRPPRRQRIRKIVGWLLGLALFWLVLQLLGVDVKGWLEQFWDSLQAIPTGYTFLALLLETGQTLFAGLA